MKREGSVKRKLSVGLFFVFLMSLVGGGGAYAQGNINVFLGSKSLEEDDWGPLDDQVEFGVKMDLKNEGWPVHLAVDLLASYDEKDLYDPFWGNIELRGSTSELAFGVRKIWENGNMHPFVGGGLALVTAEIEVCDWWGCDSEDDTALGLWLDGGVYWTIQESLNLGLNYRWSKAKTEFGPYDVEAGGTHFGLLAGFHF